MMGKIDVDNAIGQECDRIAKVVNVAIEGYLTPRETTIPEQLRKAMRYSLEAGGKRLRPTMLIMACRACGGQEIVAMPAAAAIEMIHTYSLIHDDLPAMDNDDMRRGKPTNHMVFGDGVAILAGDALLTLAFHVVASHVQKDSLVRKLVIELSDAAGASGMIGGQAQDILNENMGGTLEMVKYIHTHKTAMMFRAATRMGALCGDADDQMIDVLGDYGLKLGLAFQVIDDLLDVTSSATEMGKQTQKDAAAGKLTYPSVVGIEDSQRHADELIDEALASLKSLGENGQQLCQLAEMIAKRRC